MEIGGGKKIIITGEVTDQIVSSGKYFPVPPVRALSFKYRHLNSNIKLHFYHEYCTREHKKALTAATLPFHL